MVLSTMEATEKAEKRGRKPVVWRQVGIVKLYHEVLKSTRALNHAWHLCPNNEEQQTRSCSPGAFIHITIHVKPHIVTTALSSKENRLRTGFYDQVNLINISTY